MGKCDIIFDVVFPLIRNLFKNFIYWIGLKIQIAFPTRFTADNVSLSDKVVIVWNICEILYLRKFIKYLF